MNKFLVFISVSALFVASNSFGDYIVCSEKEITSETANTKSNAEEICEKLCKNYGGWTEAYNTPSNCKHSCTCSTSIQQNHNVAGVTKIASPAYPS